MSLEGEVPTDTGSERNDGGQEDAHAAAPILIVEGTTHEAVRKMLAYTPKLNIDDTNRVNVAVDHYEPYINFDELLRRTSANDSSFNEPGSISLDELKRL